MPVVHLCQWHSSALLQLYSTLLVIFCFFYCMHSFCDSCAQRSWEQQHAVFLP